MTRFMKCDRCKASPIEPDDSWTIEYASGVVFDLCLYCRIDLYDFITNYRGAPQDQNGQTA